MNCFQCIFRWLNEWMQRVKVINLEWKSLDLMCLEFNKKKIYYRANYHKEYYHLWRRNFWTFRFIFLFYYSLIVPKKTIAWNVLSQKNYTNIDPSLKHLQLDWDELIVFRKMSDDFVSKFWTRKCVDAFPHAYIFTLLFICRLLDT